MTDTPDDPQAAAKLVSGAVAGIQALKYAQTYGTGIIVRTEEGFFEAPNPQSIEIREIPVSETPVTLGGLMLDPVQDHIVEYVLEYGRNVICLANPDLDQMERATRITAVFDDGERRLIKNRFGLQA